jgi:hypothetical protein
MGLCLALDRDLRDPWLTSDVGDENQLFGGCWRKSSQLKINSSVGVGENQLLGQVVLVASKYSNDISSTQAVALAKLSRMRA